MEYHQGRLIDHIHLRASDLEASRRFYRAALEAVGFTAIREGADWFSADELWIDKADGPTSRVHLAFQAASRDMVDRSTRQLWPPAGATTVDRASAAITRATTRPSFWIRTATTSKPCTTGPTGARPRR
jgi:catechol 2,3-dioxygenase-like lactoylglutathione lyase family enzyme